MKLTIVTPCLNAGPRLQETVASVLAQRAVTDGRVDLEYLICDGGSSDGSIERLAAGSDPHLHVSSQPDTGMYDALARGLRMATGDVVAYLNAGDVYYPTAFDVVLALMARPAVEWLTGCGVEMSDGSVPVGFMQPFRYQRRLFERGAYGTLLPFVPQESTFWRRSLHATVDFERLAGCRLAGDYYLWLCFSSRATLDVASTFLGAFRRHPGQLSDNRGGYLAEVRAMTAPPTPGDRAQALLERALWYAPRRVKKRLCPRHFFVFDHARSQWV